jgi:hypothetical protein
MIDRHHFNSLDSWIAYTRARRRSQLAARVDAIGWIVVVSLALAAAGLTYLEAISL